MEEILNFCVKKFLPLYGYSGTFCSQFFLNTAYPSKGTAGLSAVWIPVFFFTILAAVDFFSSSVEEDLVEFLLDGSNAARIPAGDDVLDLLWKVQFLFLIDLVVLDDVDCDIVIDEAEDVEIQRRSGIPPLRYPSCPSCCSSHF